MGGKDREHGALIVGGEVEEGVERQDHVEAAAKGQAAHIGVDRLGPRHADALNSAIIAAAPSTPVTRSPRATNHAAIGSPDAAAEVQHVEPRRAAVHRSHKRRRLPQRPDCAPRPVRRFVLVGWQDRLRAGLFGVFVHLSTCTGHVCAKTRPVVCAQFLTRCASGV
jgi:hypothetical protein